MLSPDPMRLAIADSDTYICGPTATLQYKLIYDRICRISQVVKPCHIGSTDCDKAVDPMGILTMV